MKLPFKRNHIPCFVSLNRNFFILYQTTSISEACTRVVYQGTENMTITGRSMDWKEDMHSGFLAFPRGIKRDGLAGENQRSGLLNMEA